MLNGLINWSLHNRFLVVASALLMIGLGAWALPQLPIDAFPDTTPVQVQINTMTPGMGAEQVEQQVTFPIEQGLSGLPRIEQVRSLSKFGLSQVTLVFADGTDLYFARQQVAERLNAVDLPDVPSRPRLGPVTTGLGEVFHYTVRSSKRDAIELRTMQDWIIRPSLRQVSGTAEINSWGGLEKQYQARINPAKLVEYDVSFDQVVQALKSNNLNVGGGHIERAGSMFLVHGLGRTSDVGEIGNIVVATPRGGVGVRLRQVAEVAIGSDVPLGGVVAQGKGDAVLGLGFLIVGENPHEVTTKLKEKLDEVKKNLPADVEVKSVYDRTELVDHVIDTVRTNLFEGGLLVVAVLFVFLGNLRAGLIVACAIPISMLFAFTGMLRFGIAGSLLSLGALDFGLIVDSSVVMIENCVRHLAHDKDHSRPRLDVVRDAAIEVRGPTMFGELIIMIVYLPILTLEGVAGKMYRPMALTVIFALVGSMVLSLTLMPVLASLLLPRRMEEKDPWVVRLARWFYRPLLERALRHGIAVLGLAVLLLGVGGLVARGMWPDRKFMPPLSEGALVLNVLRLPGTDVNEAQRYNTIMQNILLERFPDEVENLWARCGTAEVATDPMGPEETDFFVTLKPRARWTARNAKGERITTQAELSAAIEDELKDLPGQKVTATQPIEQRVNEMISGSKAPVAVKVFGDDMEVLKVKADEVRAVLEKVHGAKKVTPDQISGLPVLRVRLRQEQLARYGVSARAVFDRVEALGGKVVGDVVEKKGAGEGLGQVRFPLAVRLPRGLRSSPELFAELLVTTPGGEQVPLSRLADVTLGDGLAKVERDWGQRRIRVQCNVDEKVRGVADFVAEARRKVDEQVRLPSARYRFEWGGEFESLQRASLRLLIVVPVALVLIFVLLYVSYGRLADVLLVFAAVPFASVGGILALWARGETFSMSAAVGFIALSGVSVLNSMVLVSFIRHLREKGVARDVAIEEAALTRLRPVLMTALVASLGFVPMALSTGVGAEVQRPLATVVIGGVLSSTLLTLLVLPVMYHFFGPAEHGPRLEAKVVRVPSVDEMMAQKSAV